MGTGLRTFCIFMLFGILVAGNIAAQTGGTVTTRDAKKDRLLQEYYDRLERERQDQETGQDLPETYHKQMMKSPDYRSPQYFPDTTGQRAMIPDSLRMMKLDTLADSLKFDSLYYLGDTLLADTIPDTLVPFGYDMFDIAPGLDMPSEVADIEGYILGPGDNIYIFLWGKVEQQYDLTIDREGKVFVPKIGEVAAWGLSIGEFEKQLKGRLSKVYSDFSLSVSLGKIRSIRVYLTGEVKKPGAYTVSSLLTLYNAMYLAGGPNPRGSLRDVRLIRNGKVEKSVDLYDFLLKGNSEGDVRLSSGDAVFVPVASARVAIDGEINRPAIYEIKDGEKAANLVEMAGGPTSRAFIRKITIARISPLNERIILNVNLKPEIGEIVDYSLQSGDSVYVFSVDETLENTVTIAGVVKQPGRYEWTDSMTVADLVRLGELHARNVYFDRANLYRKYANLTREIIPVDLNKVLNGTQNFQLRDHDSLHVYRWNEINPHKYVYIEGEVKYPGEYSLFNNMTVADLIFLAGDFTRDAYQLNIELARPDTTGRVTIHKFDRAAEEIENFQLAENDYVFVRKRPDQFLHQLASVEGEVRFPGQYALLSRDETLYDLIQRAGGFTDRAFPKGIIFYRESIGESLIRQNLPSIIERSAPIREDSLGNIKPVEFIKFNQDNVNRVIINMEELLKSEGKKGDIKLRSDDYIYVPRIPSGVSVLGAVGAEGTIKFEGGKKVSYYIQLAGNFSRNADKGAIKLIKADGQVLSGGSALGKKVELGDAIVVPTEIKKQQDWLKITSTIFSIVGGALTTILVIDRL